MNYDLLEALDTAMSHACKAWEKLQYAPPAEHLPEEEAIERATKMLSDVMDALRPIRNRLRDEWAEQQGLRRIK